MKILLTGAAGFIGTNVALSMIERGYEVVLLDNLSDYYDPARKRRNLAEIGDLDSASKTDPIEADIRDRSLIDSLFARNELDAVVHLAAMPGVRASVEAPRLYFDVNVNGTIVLLEAAAKHGVPKFVLASTSSVYGATERVPFIETDPCDRPLAPYPASKRAAEMFAFPFHHIYDLSVFVLRFFTVYGPRVRPDMMAFKIADSIRSGKEIPLYNDGHLRRDWTYVDDIGSGVLAAVERCDGYEVINLGRGAPILLRDFVTLIEEEMGEKANLRSTGLPRVDVQQTWADVGKAEALLDYAPSVGIEDGVKRFVDWFLNSGSS